MNESLPFSRRTNWPSETNRLTQDLERLREKGVEILDLTVSNPTRCGFRYPQEEILASLSVLGNLDYAPSPRGSLSAREAVSRYYEEKGYAVPAGKIILTAGTSEAYSYLFRLLANPSDHVLFPRPSYPLFSFLGHLNDVRMEHYPLVYDEKWGIDLETTRGLFCEDTRAFVLVNPNNPTGSFVRRAELQALNGLCREHGSALISDEVFADFALDGGSGHVSLVDNEGALTFVLGGISKTLGLPQMKLSWIVINGPDDLVRRAITRLEVIADTYLSVNTPVQNALDAWLNHREGIQAQINERVRANYTHLEELTKGSEGCTLLLAEGGWYAVLRIPDTYGEEEWALAFLNKDRVFVHPGYFYDFDEEAFVVVSLLPPVDAFRDGVGRILRRVSGGEL